MEETKAEETQTKVEVPIKRISNISDEPIQSNFDLIKILPIFLMLITIVGLIIYLTIFYIPNIKADIYSDIYNSSFDEGYSNGTFDEQNNSDIYYQAGGVRGYQIGQEELIFRINNEGEIPIVQYDANKNPISVNWFSIQQVCGLLNENKNKNIG